MDVQGTRLANLEFVESKPFFLNNSLLDRILVARLSLDPNDPPAELPVDVKQTLNISHFDYLLNCWKQAQEIKRNTLIRSKVRNPPDMVTER